MPLEPTNGSLQEHAPLLWKWGPSAVLLRWPEGDSPERRDSVRSVLARLESDPPEDLSDWAGAFSTVILLFRDQAPPLERLNRWVGQTTRVSGFRNPPRTIRVPVRYDGEDLDSVARASGLSVSEVVRRHQASAFEVRCLGFSPGFAYLSGLDPALRLPRRSTPRTRVAPGSVAIGGDHAGIYPVPSPGGWNLLGSTPLRPFDPTAAREADRFLFRAGDQVRFFEDPQATGPAFEPTPWVSPGPVWLRVVAAGGHLGVQDAGRPAWRRFGVPPGGWLDPQSATAANHLLGNPGGLPVFEFAGGGQALEALVPVTLAVTGADARGEVLERSGALRPVRPWSTVRLDVGERLRFRGPVSGVWSHLALCGGVAFPLVLGSVAHNARAGLGASPRAGDTVSGGSPSPHPAGSTGLRWMDPARLVGRHSGPIRVWPGPQATEFSAHARRRFLEGPWSVDPRSDRVGYRLSGEPLEVPAGSMESEPVLPGSIQVPPDGRPIVTLPDGPTLGGYPKIGWVDPRDLWRLAQTAPGAGVRWEPVGWEELVP